MSPNPKFCPQTEMMPSACFISIRLLIAKIENEKPSIITANRPFIRSVIIMVVRSVIIMIEQPFDYEQDLLESCASSNFVDRFLRTSIDKEDAREQVQSEDQACWTLFQKHAEHYNRPHQLKRRKLNDETPDWQSFLREDSKLKARFLRFLESALLVQEHNSQPNKPTFELTLNQFADVDATIIQSSDWKEDWYQLWDDESGENTSNTFFGRGLVEGVPFRKLSSLEEVQLASTEHDSHRSHYHHHHHPSPYRREEAKKHHGKKTHHVERQYIRVPLDQAGAFAQVNLPRKVDGVEVDIRLSAGYDKEAFQDDPFSESLDWATAKNPDGVPLVHDAFNQGSCGSCWAAAATGTVEASAARKAASEAFVKFTTYRYDYDNPKERFQNDSALAYAQEVERDNFQMTNLSIQELLDCDTSADQGCTGGNPLLAFFFIHRYGLTTWQDYPYVGIETACNMDLVSRPIATVESWGVLPKNHEDVIEMVLRYIGPLAVGFNGGHPSFVAYKGGIFDSPDCSQSANHAMLIVGYGQEKVALANGQEELVRYWKVRNSWGRAWGEDGYVRVKRGDGMRGTSGVCGIARSPSVALGGATLFDREAPVITHSSSKDRANFSESTIRSDSKHGLWFERVYENHKAPLLGFLAILCASIFAVWPLSYQCRRKRRRRALPRHSFTLISNEVGSSNSLLVADLPVLLSADEIANESTSLL